MNRKLWKYIVGPLVLVACEDPQDELLLGIDDDGEASLTTEAEPAEAEASGPEELVVPTASNGACPPSQGTYVAVDASLGGHALALDANGKVWSWGRNNRGQLGRGSVSYFINKPGQVNIPTKVIRIAAGENHSLALDEHGQVWGWGDASSGQLANGTPWYTALPKQVSLSKNIIAIAAGGAFSLALDNQGRVWAWGANNYGQLGNGGTVNSSSPKLVVATPGCSYIEAIAAGEAFAVGLSGGQVCTWGSNSRGQLGVAGPLYRATPAVVPGLSGVSQVSAGREYVVTKGYPPMGWGDNSAGQLGKGDGAPLFYTFPISIASDLNHRHAEAGATHTVMGYGGGFSPQPPDPLGYISTAGSNGHGELAREAPHPSRTFASIGRRGRLVSAGGDFTILVASDKVVRAAGKNNEGQLGDGTQTSTTLLTNVCLP
jgi:alpha-tubulin suppressor-like RCC1 family protein